jgi:hypothetical protein
MAFQLKGTHQLWWQELIVERDGGTIWHDEAPPVVVHAGVCARDRREDGLDVPVREEGACTIHSCQAWTPVHNRSYEPLLAVLQVRRPGTEVRSYLRGS